MSAISLRNIHKTYISGKLNVPVLHGIDLEIKNGEIMSIMGPSGSGKSTLMNIIGLLDRPTEGELSFAGDPIRLNMSDKKLAKLRSHEIGFVFQTFNLLPRYSALQNVLLPTIYTNDKNKKQRALTLLAEVGLKDRVTHTPPELSGGEKQRVAIARAMINDPRIILADEPTGNLDSKSGKEIIELLKKVNRDDKKTVIIITHDERIAKQTSRIIKIEDGKIVGEEIND